MKRSNSAIMSWDEEETEIAAPIEAQEIKLFGKWNPSDVQVSDISLTVSVLVVIDSIKFEPTIIDVQFVWFSMMILCLISNQLFF